MRIHYLFPFLLELLLPLSGKMGRGISMVQKMERREKCKPEFITDENSLGT
jgi:hypothetical protein